ncbi:YHS domain-containing protein [Glycomyces algeriensis]|jgi:YHS domain-containing protein|uniref:YHS domain-containing protein n=1 Tax=Glycomyces algeriensis TaxID=256037 RepID=A0A9W6LHW3_9ACTN|nr:YHS domain-containing protein [Glycomyces algeriensis]MDA1364516.1 YHS domain-containing protein [Glycomyces algeriensis]MDR7350551.1 YHS domain-containing protein [Glycomyces algeriensis]GLI43259.1 hypothetical protein GALLR39Z86_31090 [Glycomyces algeriensis]
MCHTEAASCCSTTEARTPAAPEDTAETTCPVMAGTPVVKAVAESKGLFRDHEGRRYWFCCAGCGPAFDADPAKYTTAA